MEKSVNCPIFYDCHCSLFSLSCIVNPDRTYKNTFLSVRCRRTQCYSIVSNVGELEMLHISATSTYPSCAVIELKSFDRKLELSKLLQNNFFLKKQKFTQNVREGRLFCASFIVLWRKSKKNPRTFHVTRKKRRIENPCNCTK